MIRDDMTLYDVGGFMLLDREDARKRPGAINNDMESLGLSQKDAQFTNKWRRRIKGATG